MGATSAASGAKHPHPSNYEIFKGFAATVTRSPLILTAIAFAVHPLYVAWTAWAAETFDLGAAGVFTLSAWIVHFGLYVICGGVSHYLDVTGKMQDYKLYRLPDMTNPRSRYVQMWTEAAVGMALSPFFVYAAYVGFDMGNTVFIPKDSDPLGSVLSVYVTFAAAKLFNTVVFYFVHRTLHHELLYARFHKQHHAWVGTVAWGAEFADPLEQVFANFIPTVIGVMVCLPHPMLFHLWLACRLHQTYESHSGYAFHNTLLYKLGLTYSDETAFHDFHHTVNKGNYSSMWIDALFGTMDEWVEQGCVEGYLQKTQQAKAQTASKAE